MQVIRFKLEIIKITIQNKKDNPCLSKPGQAHLAHPTPWQVGEEQVVSLRGHSRVGLGAVSQQQSPEDRPGAQAGRARASTVLGLGAAGSSRALGFQVSARWTGLALEIYCTLGLGVFSDLPDHQVHAGAGVLAGAVPVHCGGRKGQGGPGPARLPARRARGRPSPLSWMICLR